MKRRIRSSVFETNSSSSHCIVVTKNDRVLTDEDIVTQYKDFPTDGSKEMFYIDSNGKWNIWGDIYFGREFRVMASLEEKALYAIAEYCGGCSLLSEEEKGKKLDEIHEILFSVVPQMIDIDLPTEYIDVFRDQDGNELEPEEVFTNFEVSRESAMRHIYKRDGKIHPAKYADYIYERPKIEGIDHQSAGLLPQFLITENITLREFLLNKKYIIIEDSDECDMLSDFKRSGLFNTENIVKEYSTWDAYKDKKSRDPKYQAWLKELDSAEE